MIVSFTDLLENRAPNGLFAVAIVVVVQVCVLEVLAYTCKLRWTCHVLSCKISMSERKDVWIVTGVYFVCSCVKKGKHSIRKTFQYKSVATRCARLVAYASLLYLASVSDRTKVCQLITTPPKDHSLSLIHI